MKENDAMACDAVLSVIEYGNLIAIKKTNVTFSEFLQVR